MSQDYYQVLGVPRVINAAGTMTLLGGCRMFPKAAQDMAAATGTFVELERLQALAGERIAGWLNVEAAQVTAGASPALVQATAACIAGMDPYLRNRLPAFPPARREVVVMRCHRNPYDNAIPTAGARFVEVGDAIKTHPWELEGAINENTAAVLYVMMSEMLDASLSLETTIEIAHRANVPVIVDAAAELPPKSNLWALTQKGADVVVFSGGKEIRGPQTSGLMVGRKDLIRAAAFNGAPFYGVGRPMKASKEIVVGFLSALECYLAEDEAARFAFWEKLREEMRGALVEMDGIKVQNYISTQPGTHPVHLPKLKITLDPACDLTTDQLAALLKEGEPPVVVEKRPDGLVLNMQTLEEDEASIVVRQIQKIVSAHLKG